MSQYWKKVILLQSAISIFLVTFFLRLSQNALLTVGLSASIKMALSLTALLILFCVSIKFGITLKSREIPVPLIPCRLSDSVFYQGTCIMCSKPDNQLASLEITDTIWQCILDSVISKRVSNKEICSFAVGTPSTSHAVGCLASPETFGQLQIAIGAEYLQGRSIRIVTIERHPFVKIIDGSYSGVCFEFVHAISRKYNFSTDIFHPYDGNWGGRMSNGTWNGMVGQVIRKEADMGVAGFSVTLQRAEVISYTASFHQEPTSILIPPPTEGEKLSVIIRPLAPLVWFCLFLTILILCPTLFAFHKISQRIMGDESPSHRHGFFAMTGEILHFMIGSLLQESVISPVNKYKTTRFLIILWWLLALVMANVYVGYLVSYLSAPKLMNVVDSLEDLLGQRKIKWTFRRNTAHQSLFQSASSSGVYKAIGDGTSDSDLVSSDIDGVLKVLHENFAFIKEKSYLDVALAEDFSKSKKCRMTLAHEEFFTVETALIAQQGSPFLELMNTEISISVSTGLMDKWKLLHWPKDRWCNDAASYISSTQPKTRKLGLEDVQGAYFLFTCGITISIVAFFVEQVYDRIRRKLSSTFVERIIIPVQYYSWK